MNQRRHRTVQSLIAAPLTASILLFSSCGSGDGDNPGQAGGSPDERILPVQVEVLGTVPFKETLHLTGTIRAVDDITVSTEEGGVLKEWLVARGAAVEEGEVIALINDDVLKPAYDAAYAQYQTADLNFQKQSKVFDEAAVSELQMKSAEYARDAAKAQADLARARWERTRVKSPITGVVEDRLADAGELLPPGYPVARIVSLSHVKAVISVPERYAGTIRIGAPVSITVTAYPAERFEGKVSFVGAAVNPDNRSLSIEIVIANSNRRLKPDMIARAVISQSAEREAIVVDGSRLLQIDSDTYALFVEQDGRAVRRIVTLGARNGSSFEISSGVSAGDRLIVTGVETLYDGQPVSAATVQAR
ncbi:MAG: efflux transporter, family, subunit [Bacteroidetes bacterium]|nr:efflux transporter, family, subunit [Bacteroidota bacterium]